MDANKALFGIEFNSEEALKKARVLASERIKQSEAVLAIYDSDEMKELCTRGNISCILGKAKSRKTFFITMLSAAVISGNVDDKLFGQGKVVLFDTEQSRIYVQRVVNRIIKLTGASEDYFEVYSLRPYSPLQRNEIINEYFEKNNPDFVVIDGIRDLLTDINSCDQATELSTQLMKWSELSNSHIMCILHQNKGDNNARGHIGTEIVNKSESVLSITKDEDCSLVECEYMRGIDFEPFKFEVTEFGLPKIKDDGFVQTRKDKPLF